MIDLCKVFGVEEGEEFKIKGRDYSPKTIFKIQGNKLFSSCCGLTGESGLQLNDLDDVEEVIKLPKKKEFKDDELAIMRSLPKEYEWMARDDDGELYIFDKKPKNINGIWDNYDRIRDFDFFEHLFKSITSEDEEPVYIDDYVERGVE